MHFKHFKMAGGWGNSAKNPYQGWGGYYRRPKYNVPINIAEFDTYFEVHVYATGFSKEDIKISVVDDLLYINGQKEVEEDKIPKFIKQEFPVKVFERTLALNGQVDIKQITAKQENNILIIHLPKTEEAKEKEVNIEVS